MAVILKIDTKSNAAKSFLEFTKNLDFVSIEKSNEEYDPKFVAMVKKSAASKKRTLVKNVDEFWDSL